MPSGCVHACSAHAPYTSPHATCPTHAPHFSLHTRPTSLAMTSPGMVRVTSPALVRISDALMLVDSSEAATDLQAGQKLFGEQVHSEDPIASPGQAVIEQHKVEVPPLHATYLPTSTLILTRMAHVYHIHIDPHPYGPR
eukprot:358019-Chlamydomonas_euryale.AAC.5